MPTRTKPRGGSACSKWFRAAVVWLICLRLSLSAAEIEGTHPSPAELLSKLKKTHPRLLVSESDFMRRRTNGPAPWKTSLQAEADKILPAEPSKYEIPDGLRLLATSRRVMNRTYILALEYKVSGDKKYAARAWQELAAAADFKDWNPRHFLDTAEMTHAFAIGYDWLFDYWSEERRATLRQAMIEKGLKPAQKLYRTHTGFTRLHHNWNQVCNGGIGMGALALGDVEPEICGEILAGAIESLPLAMAEFAPDGAWREGPGYWNYATAYNVVFLAGLDSAVGTDFGLSSMPGFDQTGSFPIYMTGPLRRTFNYADGGDGAFQAPQLEWLARRFGQPVFSWYDHQGKKVDPQEIIWRDPATVDVSPGAALLPLDKYFRGAEVALLRSAWDDPKAVFVGFKAGDNKANHSHLDLGSFVLDADGVRWAVDLGADDYNLPAYFGGQRWNYYRLRAEGHNTVILDPDSTPDQDPKAAGQIIQFESKPRRAFAIADLTAAHKQRASMARRGIMLSECREVLVQDEIKTAEPASIWWFMHTQASIRLEKDGREAVLEQGGKEFHAWIRSPDVARFEVMAAEPLPGSPHPEGQAKNQNIRKLAIHLESVRDVRIAVLLFPGPASGVSIPAVRPLSEW